MRWGMGTRVIEPLDDGIALEGVRVDYDIRSWDIKMCGHDIHHMLKDVY